MATQQLKQEQLRRAAEHRTGKTKTIHLVPHTHYDVVWAFVREDYAQINKLILSMALKMIREQGYKFLIEQSYPIEQIEQTDPEMFEELKHRIAEGSIEVVDGQYIMPDPMIPHGETLVRDILVGKQYLKETLGIDVPVAWAADGFGINAQMPQIYKKSGYRWLAFRRGLSKSVGRRVSEFLWEGLDGTKIIAHWMPLGYRAGLDADNWSQAVARLSQLSTNSHMMLPCGSGGVPPLEETPSRVREWNEKHGDSLPMVISTPSEFFRAFDSEGARLVTYKGELYSADLESIFPDVVSSRIRLKIAIKTCEQSLLLAEKMAALAYMSGAAYPDTLMKSLWKKMLFLAQHDVLPCSGIDEIYKDAWRYIGEINRQAGSLSRSSAMYLAGNAGSGQGHYILVFNPNNWEVTNWVQAEVQSTRELPQFTCILLGDQEMPTEVQDWSENGKTCRVGFVATVPPLGFRVYRRGTRSREHNVSIEVKDSRVRTKHFELEVDPQTGVVRAWDTEGVKILEGNEVIIDEEIGDLYFHQSRLDQPIGAEGGGAIRFGAFRPEEFRIEQTPVRTVITYRSSFFCLRWPYYLTEKFGAMLYRHKTIDILKRIIVYEDIPRIDFVTKLDSRQSHVRIRLKFDTCMVRPSYCRQTQFGVLDLPFERVLNEGIKVPSLVWVNAEENNRGLAFLSASVPINEINGPNIYYTLLRSVSVLSSDGISGPLIPVPDAMELGRHTFRYSVYPHQGDWREANIHRRSHEFSRPIFALPMQSNPHEEEFRSFELEPDNLVLSCLKQAEREDAVILRFFETKGQACTASLRFPRQITSVRYADLLERDERPLELAGGLIQIPVGPFEIVTLKLSLNR